MLVIEFDSNTIFACKNIALCEICSPHIEKVIFLCLTLECSYMYASGS